MKHRNTKWVALVEGHRVRCYDNGGASCDRYTVVAIDKWWEKYDAYAMSASPFSPQGVGLTTSVDYLAVQWGPQPYGKPMYFFDLPEDCRRAVVQWLAS